MPSTYTTNLGIEKIESGAQTGVWGTTTNTNLDIIDQGINGVHTETLAVPGDSSSPNTLPITDGATSAGRNKLIEFVDGGDLGATAYVQLTPNDAEKIVFMRNSLSGGRSVIVFQGTYNASNDFEIPNGKDVVLKFDGAGVGATVTNVFNSLRAEGVSLASGTTVTSILDEDDMSSDSDTALATQQSIKAYVDAVQNLTAVTTDILPNTDNNNDLGSASKRWQDLYLSGGLYIGGTTSANYLSDYEEGTFTMTTIFSGALVGGTIVDSLGSYTKVGRKVYLYGWIEGSAPIIIDSGTSIGYIIFAPVPFYSDTGTGVGGSDTTHGSGGDATTFGFTSNKTAFMPCAVYNSDWSWGATNGLTGTKYLSANVTYLTDGTSPP
jgi:hypothetical protein